MNNDNAVQVSVQFGDGPVHQWKGGCFWPTLIGGLLLVVLVIL